jgi:hypothetical protein
MSDQLSTITNIVFIDAAAPDYQNPLRACSTIHFVLMAQKDDVWAIITNRAGYGR